MGGVEELLQMKSEPTLGELNTDIKETGTVGEVEPAAANSWFLIGGPQEGAGGGGM